MPWGYDRALRLAVQSSRLKAREWPEIVAGVPGFIASVIGRTDFWEPVMAWRSKQASREQAVAAIAERYREFVDRRSARTFLCRPNVQIGFARKLVPTRRPNICS
jgi:myo-inositol catabolism protein IolC